MTRAAFLSDGLVATTVLPVRSLSACVCHLCQLMRLWRERRAAKGTVDPECEDNNFEISFRIHGKYLSDSCWEHGTNEDPKQ